MNHHLAVYKAVAAVFLVAVIVSSIFVLHFALAKATIIITTKTRPVTVEKEFMVTMETVETAERNEGAPSPSLEALSEELKMLERSLKSPRGEIQTNDDSAVVDLKAEVIQTLVSGEKRFTPSNQGKSIEGVARGVVTILNDANYNQTLVANTRLLTLDNILFRLDERVTVPKKGSREVTAHADQKGPSGDIPSAVFTIPGLSRAAQKLIYAKSEKPFAGGLTRVGIVTKADITDAQIALVEELENKGLIELNKQQSSVSLKDLFSEVQSLSSSAEEGEAQDEFTVQGTLLVRAVVFDKAMLHGILKEKLQQMIRQDEAVIGYDGKSFDYVITNFDKAKREAEIKGLLTGFITMGMPDKEDLKKILAGETQSEVRDRFLANQNISAVTVRFWPFWVTRVTRLPQRVEIVVVGE